MQPMLSFEHNGDLLPIYGEAEYVENYVQNFEQTNTKLLLTCIFRSELIL